MEKLQPFQRKIHPDELWLYKNPLTESYVPSKMLWVNMNIKMWVKHVILSYEPFFLIVQPIVVFAPLIVIFMVYFFRREVTDVTQALLSLTLALGINGIVTDIIKLTVGKKPTHPIVLFILTFCTLQSRETTSRFFLAMLPRWSFQSSHALHRRSICNN